MLRIIKILFVVVVFFLTFPHPAHADDSRCPLANLPPPLVLKPDMGVLMTSLEKLKDDRGNRLWQRTPESEAELTAIFSSSPQKTKLEQFFQLLFVLQKRINLTGEGRVTMRPPAMTDVLLAAKVFTTPDFPKHITEASLILDPPRKRPYWSVLFDQDEVRFPINGGRGFDSWEQGMCQTAKELIFYPDFSFSLRQSPNTKNLIVDDFDKVQISGQFGSRTVFKIDIQYVDLERVEFINGTDQGKVKARVAKREFQENPHSSLFKFVGSLIPNTSKQRIDW